MIATWLMIVSSTPRTMRSLSKVRGDLEPDCDKPIATSIIRAMAGRIEHGYDRTIQ
jgi:hypothetical protein